MKIGKEGKQNKKLREEENNTSLFNKQNIMSNNLKIDKSTKDDDFLNISFAGPFRSHYDLIKEIFYQVTSQEWCSFDELYESFIEELPIFKEDIRKDLKLIKNRLGKND